MADEFEKANSGIKIKIQVTGWADYWTALEAGATGGSLPDTFWMHSNLIYKYASNDQLLNLNDKIKASKKIEMANKDSDLYRAHTDWIIATPGRRSSPSRNQYVLDFSRKESERNKNTPIHTPNMI